MALVDDFNAAVAGSKDLTTRPSNEDLLELYALFKQATEGDITGERPMGFDFKAIAKYGAWEGKKGLDKDTAMEHYVKLMNRLKS
ncbi:MAG: acyl-CoA-binding protein [Bacteroidota bacterium]|jgi:diazepam-binding inhibitor (GABA receptor modulating acyl-CoA-binding protein)|nr:acyl-CoA-binding protein [Cytophagales bacterium]MCE2957240.1 acyl-CoA-binding protein [Flammeovirgaceae bacterium]MCZ8071936.1 acyl-CoA-binding protein [Cytophagales bacterium]